MLKKAVSLLVVCIAVLAIGMSSTALTVPAGGTGYTSKKYLGATHSTYYCKLDSVKFKYLSQNYIPSGTYIYARIRTELGTPCGDAAGFSTVGYGYNYNYWSGYGGPAWYKLATNSNLNQEYSVTFTWNP